MAIQLQLRRGTLSENDLFIGQPGEVSVDLTTSTLRVHDGITTGGHELAKANLSNSIITKSLTPVSNGSLDVGTNDTRWRNLYVTNSIKIDSISLDKDPLGGLKITSIDLGTFVIDQDLSKSGSPTFENLTINGTIFGYEKGNPFSVVANNQERNELALDVENRTAGMLALTTDTNKIWQLKSDFQTWQEFIPRPVKQTAQKPISLIPASGFIDFELDIGNSVIVYQLSVSHPCTFEVFDSADRDDMNPFRFIATEDHLTDDGSSLLSDGTIVRGRRYHIWSSFSNINKIYCRVTNLSDTDISNFTAFVRYSVLEYSLSI